MNPLAQADFAKHSSAFQGVGLRPWGQNIPLGLGTSSNAGGDQVGVPWHPDSPIFWGVILLAAVLFGVVGLTADGRAGPIKVSGEAGKV